VASPIWRLDHARYLTEPLPRISEAEFFQRMRSAFADEANRPLREKPFFVAKAADSVLNGIQFGHQGLLAQLAASYIERERTEKLLDKSEKPLLTAAQITKIVQLVCDEMWLQETRVPGDSGISSDDLVAPEIIDLLERLMLRFRHANVFWPSDDQNRALVADRNWEEIQTLLLESHLIAIEKERQHRGQHRHALRRVFLPSQIMAGMDQTANVPDEIRAFWKAVRQKFAVPTSNVNPPR